jgi:steroid delta-isomerase-like uncharacterized protein
MSIQITAQQLGEKVQQAWANSDAAALAALYAEDATLDDMLQVVHGREAIERSSAEFFRAFTDTTVEFRNIMTSGDHFIYEGTTRGTHTGTLATPVGEVPPTGRKIEIPFAFIAKMSPEGLIQDDRTYTNSALMMQQLGLV